MKPKLGRTVYIIFVRYSYVGISKEQVGYLGKSSFIVEDYKICMDDCQEYMYNEVGVTWCTSLANAKKACKAMYGVKKFEKTDDLDYWEAEREH